MSDSATKLAKAITRKSSFQTYATILLLVDRPLVNDCFKAYAYFRWLDDQIDIVCKTQAERLNFIKKQKLLIERSFDKKVVEATCPEEQMIFELITTDTRKKSKLGSFILKFFAIIEFDAHRKGRTITQQEYDWYTSTLSRAVTDGIEHFINHSFSYPDSADHYRAGIGAHITHMLRDYHEDIPEGYVNIPQEYLSLHKLQASDSETVAFKMWVKQQVKIARKHFTQGKKYIHALPVLRGKLAASWYCARFVCVLDEIEKDNFQLRQHYSRHGKLVNYLRMIWIATKVIVIHYL